MLSQLAPALCRIPRGSFVGCITQAQAVISALKSPKSWDIQCRSHAGITLGCSVAGMVQRGHVLLLHLGLGIPSGSKTAPEKGLEEEINGNKICLEAAAAAGGVTVTSAPALSTPGSGSRPARPLPAPWGEFGGVWGCSVFQRSGGRVPPPLSAPDLSQCFVASLGFFSF